MVGSIYVPGIGQVPIKVTGTREVHGPTGIELHVSIAPVLPNGPGGGEPLPLGEVA